MDKAGFLRELQQYLQVLNESEQKDILDEYAQHIDMKMERGMSEAEATGDFGGIEELAAEILEAYHVNPNYSIKNRKKLKLIHSEELPVGEIKETGKRVWSRGAEGIKKWGRQIATFFRAAGGLMAVPFQNAARAWRDRKQNPMKSEKLPKGKKVHSYFGTAGRMMKRAVMFCIMIVVTCVRWCWNLAMIFIALVTGMVTLMCVFITGTILVLLTQGYPLIGIFIGSMGLVVCGGAVTAMAAAFIVSKHKADKEEAQDFILQEVAEHA